MTRVQTKSLARVDLNLLVVLDLLLKEKHVSRVAQEMFVSQSAISRSLKRLRETFDDPLFTRSAKGLIPTAKALQLEKDLKKILPGISKLINDAPFSAQQCEQAFSLSIPPFISSILIPELFQYLQLNAPKVSITEVATKTSSLQLLDSNQLDFAFHYEHNKSPKHCATLLGYVYPVLYVRKGHPLSQIDKVDLKQVMQYPLIGMFIEDDANQSFRSPITQLFQELTATQQKPALRANQTWTLLNILRKSDSVLFGANGLTALDGFAEEFVEVMSLKAHNKYVLPVYLMHHVRNESSDAHHWFGELLQKLSAEIIQ